MKTQNPISQKEMGFCFFEAKNIGDWNETKRHSFGL
jgi:hypothetical protein